MAQEVHNFCKNENAGQHKVYILQVLTIFGAEPLLPEGISRIGWVQEVERDEDPKEQPVVAHFLNYLVQWFRWLAIEMHENALDESFNKMSESHLEGYVLT